RDLRDLGLSYDLFTRTTTRNHYRVVQDLFRTVYEHGYIVEQTTIGAFPATTGHALPARYIEGTCPICGFEFARGDQCDNCGNQLDPVDLIDPRSKIDGAPPVFKETSHLFLDLPAFAERLTEWVERQGHWRPNVRNFSLGLLKDLKPRPITRDLDWGVPIPVPPEYAERDDKRIYVWFDAVIGYLSAAVEWAINRGTPEAWREWWQDPEARHLYFMGKDNIVFHTVIWPSILLGYGEGGELGAGFETVGDLIEAARYRAALAEAMKLATLVNRYTDHQAPWALIESDRERAGTVLYVALRAIDSLKTIFTPFLPFSSQTAHELLGYEGTIAGQLELREVGDDEDPHEVLTGDYESWTGG